MSKTKYVRVRLTERQARALWYAARLVDLIEHDDELDYACHTHPAALALVSLHGKIQSRPLKEGIGKLQLEVSRD